MAKPKAPLFSIEAHGTIGDELTFSTWKGIPRCRRHFKPKNPQTGFQQLNRSNIFHSVNRWKILDTFSKDFWELVVCNRQYKMSGYNFFISNYNNNMIIGNTPADRPGTNLLPTYPVLNGLTSWWKLAAVNAGKSPDEMGNSDAISTAINFVNLNGVCCAELDGTTSLIEVPHNSKFRTPAFTLEIWVKSKDTAWADWLIFIGSRGWALNHSDDAANDVFCYVYSGGIFYGIRVPLPPEHDITKWHLYTFCYDGATRYYYVDGILYHQETINKDADLNFTNSFWICCDEYPTFNRHLNGYCHDAKIYNRALSIDEIVHNYSLFELYQK